MRTPILSLLICAIVLSSAQYGRADEPDPFAFGALAPMTETKAKSNVEIWLKGIGKNDEATTKQLRAIWNQPHRSVLERVTDSLMIGSPEAAGLLAQANNSKRPIPAFADDAKTVKTPALFTDKKLPAFFRSNLALAYAQRLVRRGVFEEGLVALKTTRASDVVDPASYLFHRAVCEHGMLDQKNATGAINRLLEDIVSPPERYKTVSVLMLLDMQTWKEKDLASIARKMKNIERRLDLTRGGPRTQKLQREVVRRLDEIIKKLENQQKKKQGGGSPNGGSCPNGGPPGSTPGGSNNPSSPMPDSVLPQAGGEGTVTQAKIRKLAGQWGSLPERERERILQDLTRGMTPSHREAVENYFRKLSDLRSR